MPDIYDEIAEEKQAGLLVKDEPQDEPQDFDVYDDIAREQSMAANFMRMIPQPGLDDPVQHFTDPKEDHKRVLDAIDIAKTLGLPITDVVAPENYWALVAKPGFRERAQQGPQLQRPPSRSKWQKFKHFFQGDEAPHLTLYPDGMDRIEKFWWGGNYIVTQPLNIGLKYLQGKSVIRVPDLIWAAMKRATPEDTWTDEVRHMTLEEAMDFTAGYSPTGFQKAVGELAEFVGRLQTIGPIAQKLGIIGNTPKSIGVLGKAFETSKLFGTAAVGEQAAKFASEKIDPTEAEYGYEGPKAVLRDMAIGAALSIVSSGVKAVWGKLVPSERVRMLRLLKLKEGATTDKIRTAAQKMARQYHPDKIKGFEAEFKKVIKARDALTKSARANVIEAGKGAKAPKVAPKPPIQIEGVTIAPDGSTAEIEFRGAQITVRPQAIAKAPAKAPTSLVTAKPPAEAAVEGESQLDRIERQLVDVPSEVLAKAEKRQVNPHPKPWTISEAEYNVREFARARHVETQQGDITHENIVQSALNRGLDVPPVALETLTPEQIEKSESTAPWTMTKSEFELETIKARNVLAELGDIRDTLGEEAGLGKFAATTKSEIFPSETHKTIVERAVKNGKPVPAEVLADYPDLAQPKAQGAEGGIAGLSREDTINTIKEGFAGKENILDGWFRDGNKSFKPRLVAAIEASPEIRNAALNLFHQEYQRATGSELDFETFANTPIELFRAGKRDTGDAFTSYSFSRSMAEKHGENIVSIKILPRDTLGVFQTIAEGEVLVPQSALAQPKAQVAEVTKKPAGPITTIEKDALREKGYTVPDILGMSPAQARDTLAEKPPSQPPHSREAGFADLTPIVEAGEQLRTAGQEASKLVTRFQGLESGVQKSLIEYEEQLRELPKVIAAEQVALYGHLTPEQEVAIQKAREDPTKHPLPEDLQKTMDTLNAQIKQQGKRLEDLGYTADWPNNYVKRLEGRLAKLNKAEEPDVLAIEELEQAIEEAKGLQYLHHYYEPESTSQRVFRYFQKRISKKPRGLLGRKIPTLEKARELGLEPAPLAVSQAHAEYELRRAEEAGSLIRAVNDNPNLSQWEDVAPKDWVYLDEKMFPSSVQHRAWVEKGKPRHSKKRRKYPVPIADALNELTYSRTHHALTRWYDKFNQAMKIIGFYNPLVMTKNDFVQGWRGAGFRYGLHLPKALKIFIEKGETYEALRKGGLFNNVVNWGPSVTEMTQAHLDMIRQTWGQRVANKAKKYLNPLNVIDTLHMANEATTWNMDEIMRIATWDAIKSQSITRGMTDFEVIELANDFMANYGKLPKATKEHLNRAFFVPSYRIGNFRLWFGKVLRHPWRFKGPLLRTVGYKLFIQWGLPALATGAIAWYTGVRKKNIRTEKGYRLVIPNLETGKETVYSLSDPLLEGTKATQRTAIQTFTNNLAAVPSLIARLVSGPRFRNTRDPFGEFFKLGTPIYRDIIGWTDPDKTVPQKILTQLAIAYVYSREARPTDEDKKISATALAKALSIWTDWKEQKESVQKIVTGKVPQKKPEF